MSKFYQEYKEHRENQSITLAEISERTKINIDFLRAIEEGNFDLLPETYTRLFLRAYATEIGVDPDEAIEQYNLLHGKPRAEKPKREPADEEESTVPEEPSTHQMDIRPRRSFNWKQSLIVILVFAFILYAVKSYVGSSDESTTIPEETSPTSEEVVPADTLEQSPGAVDEGTTEPETTQDDEEPEPQPQNQSAVTPQEATPETPGDAFELQFSATERTWVRIRQDTLPNQEFTFFGDDSRVWRAQSEIRLMIGNAGGAQIRVNDRSYTNLGEQNEVVSLLINENGIVERRTVQPAQPRSSVPMMADTS